MDGFSCHQHVTAWIIGYTANQENCETDKDHGIFCEHLLKYIDHCESEDIDGT